VVVDRDGDEAEIRVEDTGQGIPPSISRSSSTVFTACAGPMSRYLPKRPWPRPELRRVDRKGARRNRRRPQRTGKGTTFRIRLPLNAPPMTPDEAALIVTNT